MIESISYFLLFSFITLVFAWFYFSMVGFTYKMFFTKIRVAKVILGLLLYLVGFVVYATLTWITIVMGVNFVLGEKLI